MTTRPALALPELAWPPANLPKVARDQADVQPFERDLLDLARVHHPRVTWWHGYRMAEERYGSYCYVCERFTVTWNRSNAGPPKAAVEQISAHKWQHRDGTVVAAQPTRKRHTQ